MKALRFLSQENRKSDGALIFRFTVFDENADPLIDPSDAPNLLVFGIVIRVQDDVETILSQQSREFERIGFAPLSPIIEDKIRNECLLRHTPEIKALWSDYLVKAAAFDESESLEAGNDKAQALSAFREAFAVIA